MAGREFDSATVSAFCGSMATMISAGIQADEAVYLFAENCEGRHLKQACEKLYLELVSGSSFADALDDVGGFPRYAIDMVALGERSGHLERVLGNLETYYDEEGRLFSKLRTSLGYPAILLCIMAPILVFTVLAILPVFTSVYEDMAGSLTAGSFSSVNIATWIAWAALAITVVSAAWSLMLVVWSRTERGQRRVVRLLQHLGTTKKAMYQLALSRFTAGLATLMSSGATGVEAMNQAVKTVDHGVLRAKLQRAADSMVDPENPRTITQAIAENDVFEPLYARLFSVGTLSGSADGALKRLSEVHFEDAVRQIDQSLDKVEPVFIAFLTLAVGATLVSVMLPLVGVMASIG